MTKKLQIIKDKNNLIPFKTKRLIKMTNKILVNEKSPANQCVDTIHDDSWIEPLLKWLDENIIQDNTYFLKDKKILLNIKEINLRWNRLETLPKELFFMTQLKKLELANNSLRELPKEIQKLQKLEELNLNINNLETLPKDIIKLKKLKKLNIKNNKNLKITEEQILWLKDLVANECVVKHDKYKYNIGE